MAHWKQRQTVFAEYGLWLTMPGAWQLRPSDDPHRWLFRSADHREHLTISMAEAEYTRNADEREAAMRRALARNRRAAELGFARVTGLSITEPEFGARAGAVAGWYSGDAGSEHRFSALLLNIEGALWSFFYEAFRLPAEEANARAETIYSSIGKKG